MALSAAAFAAGGILVGLVVWFYQRRRLGMPVEEELALQEDLSKWQHGYAKARTALIKALKEVERRKEAGLAADVRLEETSAALAQTLKEAAAVDEARRVAEARAEAAEQRAEKAASHNENITRAAEEQIRRARAELEELRKKLEDAERARLVAVAELARLRKTERQDSAPAPEPKPVPQPEPVQSPPHPATQSELPKTYSNSIGVEFVLIPAGSFLMGSGNDERDAADDEKPQHEVTISHPFLLGKYPVTQAQWLAVMGNKTRDFQGSDRPVENVSWDDALVFIRKLNAKERHNRYRLPTEAEWEYACRAGATGRYCFGDNKGGLGNYAWYADNSGGETHSVGQKRANAWGLHDMHGNIWEWCSDWYSNYCVDSVVDPQGPSSGENRVLRGGCSNIIARGCQSAFRSWAAPDTRSRNNGFRLVLDVM